MIRTQVQLPDALYARAKRFAEERELSLAELTRRGLELFLARFPAEAPARGQWKLPAVNGGGIKVPLREIREILAEDEDARGRRK